MNDKRYAVTLPWHLVGSIGNFTLVLNVIIFRLWFLPGGLMSIKKFCAGFGIREWSSKFLLHQTTGYTKLNNASIRLGLSLEKESRFLPHACITWSRSLSWSLHHNIITYFHLIVYEVQHARGSKFDASVNFSNLYAIHLMCMDIFWNHSLLYIEHIVIFRKWTWSKLFHRRWQFLRCINN